MSWSGDSLEVNGHSITPRQLYHWHRDLGSYWIRESVTWAAEHKISCPSRKPNFSRQSLRQSLNLLSCFVSHYCQRISEVAEQSIAAAFSSLSNFICRLSMIKGSSFDRFFFLSKHLCEEAFFQMKIIKSRYRSRLTDEHLNTAVTCTVPK